MAFIAFAALTVLVGLASANTVPTVNWGAIGAHPLMVEHSNEFNTKTITKVTDGVYHAVGYALANTIFIRAPSGWIIVDTTEAQEAGAETWADFKAQVDATTPICAFVYTHNHADHVAGTAGFMEDHANPDSVQVYAHTLLPGEVTRWQRLSPRWMWGNIHQFALNTAGANLMINEGIGPFIASTKTASRKMTHPPTHLVTGDGTTQNVCGMDVAFIWIPGETQDQIAVYADMGTAGKIMLPADDFYRTFPNLYAIRGTPARNIQQWADSLAKMRTYNADFLIPSHTRHVAGASLVSQLLLDYQLAITYIHDQTIRQINKAVQVDELVNAIDLPSSLKNHPWLLQFYGQVEASAKAVYDMYLGWFNADVTDLRPLTKKDRSTRLVGMMGEYAIESEVAAAAGRGEWQWVIELTSMLRKAGHISNVAQQYRLDAFVARAEAEINIGARHWYLTAAALEAGQPALPQTIFDNLFWGDATLALDILHDLMRFRVRAEAFTHDMSIGVSIDNGPAPVSPVNEDSSSDSSESSDSSDSSDSSEEVSEPYQRYSNYELSIVHAVFRARTMDDGEVFPSGQPVIRLTNEVSWKSILVDHAVLQSEMDAGNAEIVGERSSFDAFLSMIEIPVQVSLG